MSKNTTKQDVLRGSLKVSVHDSGGSLGPLANVTIRVFSTEKKHSSEEVSPERLQAELEDMARREVLPKTGVTGSEGVALISLEKGFYIAAYGHYPETHPQYVEVENDRTTPVVFHPKIHAKVNLRFHTPDGEIRSSHNVRLLDRALATIEFEDSVRLADHVQVRPVAPWEPMDDERLTFWRTVRQVGEQRFEAEMGFDLVPYSPGRGALEYAPLSPTPVLIAGVAESANLPVSPASARLARLGASSDLPLPPTSARLAVGKRFSSDERVTTPISGSIGVSMTRTETEPTKDLPFWTLIRNSTDAMSFNNYLKFMDALLSKQTTKSGAIEAARGVDKKLDMFKQLRLRPLPFADSDAYRVLRAATEAFVMVNCGVLSKPMDGFDNEKDQAYLDRRDIPGGTDLSTVFGEYVEKIDNTNVLPYLAIIRRKLPDVQVTIPNGTDGEVDLYFGIVQQKLASPCLLELIWSYWHEEGMLVQTMNAITQRFQNVRSVSTNDPLANLEIDPLRPLNNLIWGYTQDEQHRLTVVRRNYEYDHHYGVRLDGKAVQHFRPADTRSKFLEALHYLLRLCTVFYRQDDDTTVKADAFPLLNALKEVHLILSQGAHNQFGDLVSTARIEMLMQQWMLARPEFRDFLPTRVMVAYPEPWMDRVDAMKKVQGWSDTSVLHFRNLALFGEQVLLSVRYGAWSDIFEPTQAFNWARFWRPQVQGYVHAYRAATGVDLTIDARDPQAEGTMPSILLRQRLAQQTRA